MFTSTTFFLVLAATLTTTTAQIRVGGPCGTHPGTPPITGPPVTPLSGTPGFELMTIPISSTTGRNLQPYSGLFLSAPAGVPILSNNQSAATYLNFNAATGDIFYYNRTVMNNPLYSTPQSLHLYPGIEYGPGLPATGLSPVAFSLGPAWANSNFSFDATTNLVTPPCGGRFMACALNTTSFQLFWSDQEVVGECTDVVLKAVAGGWEEAAA